jgi:uncharacterized iron-regulated membrane protein
MGRRPRGAPSAKLVKLKTRRQRRMADFMKKLGIWLFLLLFVMSVAGVVLITIGTSR